MSALTSNQQVIRSDKTRNGVPCAASVHHFEGGLAYVNSSGFADVVTNSGANKFAGVVFNEFDNSLGSNGGANPQTGAAALDLFTDGVFVLNGSGFTQATVGQLIYGVDSGTVSATATNNSRIGTCMQYFSATQIAVRLVFA